MSLSCLFYILLFLMLGLFTLRIYGFLPESLDGILFVSALLVLFIGIIGEQQRFNRSLRRSGVDIAQLPPPFRWLRAPRFWWSLLTLIAVALALWIAGEWRFGCYRDTFGISSQIWKVVRSSFLSLIVISPSLLVQKSVFPHSGRTEKILIFLFFLIISHTIYSDLQALCP